ncbi:Transcriptional regulator, contains XRE-family HTH domain [Dyadobacter soli]|uniref:Transcriptional regulator, contains XRE-family HTH domain n=1 Tax=Dyadobacter soli TaxID=659014 RepID=A0A1G7VAE1_9BACT|nr:helix-turn-helix transcriptional regulator [Dyadobacter soli]SDG56511.1 Transcriptional regulator, contains XRE-family HTH domain [Dyadobacter soli]
MEIGTLLRKLRDHHKVSSRLIAEKVGISHTTYLDWEHEKSSPSLKHFFRLADAFKMTPVDMISYLTGEAMPDQNQSSHLWNANDVRKILKDYQEHFELLKDLKKDQN